VSGTNAAAVKSRLVGTGNVLEGLSGMTGVKVAYDPPRDMPREIVFAGDAGGPVELEAFRADSTSRVSRDENLDLELFIQVYQPGLSTSETTDTRATAISAIIENYIAANPTLGALANLLAAKVAGVRLVSVLNDDGATSLVVLTISLQSVLT
jgi:hypothetical protein